MGFRDQALRAARDYLKANPREITRAARSLLGLRASIPLAAFRWLADQVVSSGKVKALRVAFREPGVQVGADLDLMATPVRAEATVFIERISLTEEELLVGVRLEGVKLQLTDHAETPVAMLIASGALDLSNPGTLVGYLPKKPPILVEAEGSRIVVDLMRDRKLGQNPKVRQVVGLVTSFLTVHGVESSSEHLDIELRTFPRGYVEATRAVKRHVVDPALRRYLPALAR